VCIVKSISLILTAYRYKVSAITMVNNVEKRVTTGEVLIEVSPPDTGGDTIVPGTGMHTIQNALIHY